jgi:hypothetical protein
MEIKTLDLETLELKQGVHEPYSHEMCFMEAVAMMAGETWSDRPQCASPVISAFMRHYNDSVSYEVRQTLKPYIVHLIGTAGDNAIEERRELIAADWLIRTHTPAWLRLCGLTSQSDALSSLPEITSLAQVLSTKNLIEEAHDSASDAVYAALNASRDYGRDDDWADARMADGVAAWAATGGSALRDAGFKATWAAALTAHGEVAWGCSFDAALTAALTADGEWALEKLNPTVDGIQATIPALIDRMLDCK